MQTEKLKETLNILRNQINVKESGTREFSDLCIICGDLDRLIWRLENVDKAKKIDKMVNPDDNGS